MNLQTKTRTFMTGPTLWLFVIIFLNFSFFTVTWAQVPERHMGIRHLQMVSSGLTSLSNLRITERMNVLRAVLNVWPEDFIAFVSEPGNQRALSDEQFLRCALAVGGFAKVFAGSITNIREIQDIAASHGFDPSIAFDVAAGDTEVKQAAMDIAATNEAAVFVLTNQKHKLLDSPFYAQKLKAFQNMRSIFAQIGNDLPFGLDRQLKNKAIIDLYNGVRLQSSSITSIVCPLM